MRTRQALIVLVAGSFLPPATFAAPAHAGVNVRIYNAADLPVDARQTALALVSRTLAASRIGVHWIDCGTEGACATPPAPGELVVRLVRSARSGTAAARLVLGEAAIDMTAGAGVLASIYVDRVELMAGLAETDMPSLLGRAIAHEVGHLLLASNAHSARGLMRARWSPNELRRNEALDWLLADDDAARIRQRLSGR